MNICVELGKVTVGDLIEFLESFDSDTRVYNCGADDIFAHIGIKEGKVSLCLDNEREIGADCEIVTKYLKE